MRLASGINRWRLFAKFLKFGFTSGTIKNSGDFGNFNRFVIVITRWAKEISGAVNIIIALFNQRPAKLFILFCLAASIQCFNAVAGDAETPASNKSGYNSSEKSRPVASEISTPKVRDHSVYCFIMGFSIGAVVAFHYYNRKNK